MYETIAGRSSDVRMREGMNKSCVQARSIVPDFPVRILTQQKALDHSFY